MRTKLNSNSLTKKLSESPFSNFKQLVTKFTLFVRKKSINF